MAILNFTCKQIHSSANTQAYFTILTARVLQAIVTVNQNIKS